MGTVVPIPRGELHSRDSKCLSGAACAARHKLSVEPECTRMAPRPHAVRDGDFPTAAARIVGLTFQEFPSRAYDRSKAVMPHSCRSLLTTALLLLSAGPLCAQKRFAISVGPRVGMVSPDALLYEQYANFSGDGPVEWTDGSVGRALVVGLGFQVGRPAGGVYLRGEVMRSFGAWLSVSRSIVQPRVLFDPPYVETTWLDVPASVVVTTLELVVPTRLVLWRAQPYVVAGVGGKRYDFGEPTAANDVNAVLPHDGFTWGGDVGAGVTAPVMGLTLDLQARDAFNRYWGKTEHDLVYSAGVLWRIR